jgi:hypothetical protein
MGDTASLLEYLPYGLVKNKDRPETAVPIQMHFGHLINGHYNAMNLGILLYTGVLRCPPEQRYRRFSRFSDMMACISMQDALDESEPTVPFSIFRQPAGIDKEKL